MPEFLKSALASAAPSNPREVAIRLVLAVILGAMVAWVYQRTRDKADITPTFPVTLVLLSALIAMVTQVVGDNVARAFSLVGALSIVRFRTVVRDTQDTAFVIFAVVIGMAVGASDLIVAGIGVVVVGAAAFIMRPPSMKPALSSAPVLVTLRMGLGHELEAAVGASLDSHLIGRRLVSIATVKQGLSIDVAYEGRLKKDGAEETLVKTLNRMEGVQSVELRHRSPFEE